MEDLKYSRILTDFFVLCCILITITANADASDEINLKRLEKIIMQQQEQTDIQSKTIESLRMYVDNNNSSTHIGTMGSAKGSEELEVGTKIEVQFESNSSSAVDQNNKREVGDNNFTKHHLDLFLKSIDYGKLSVGFGSAASDGTSQTDFSGTSVVGFSGIEGMAEGQLFYDNDSSVLSSTTIADVYNDLGGLGRQDRVRYDTPSFSGFSVATSYIADGGGDIAFRYISKINQYKLGAALSYADPGGTRGGEDYQFSGSASLLHDKGISLTLSGGQREFTNNVHLDAWFFYTKLGYQADFFSIGKTAISMDFSIYEEMNIIYDEATTFGAQFAQNLEKWGAEYYFGFRYHSLDRDNKDYEDINSILSGFRVKF